MAKIYPLNSLNNQAVVTVTIKFTHLLRFRIWLGMKVIALGCWIATIGFKLEDEN